MDDFTACRAPFGVRDLRFRAALTVVGAAVVAAAGGVGTTTPAQLDARFVDDVRAEGRHVPPGHDGEIALVAAARKICLRRDHHDTVAERRATRLTGRELAAVGQSFATDSGRFVTLAVDTYCP